MVYDLIWKDYLEIGMLTLILYAAGCWLQQDTQRKLLKYAVGYAFGVLAAYLLELPTLLMLCIWYAPTIAILFVLMHQKTLQRNFVALTHTPPQIGAPDEWLESLMSLCLYNMHHVRATRCVIQHTLELNDFLHSSFALNTPVQQDLLTLLCDSSAYHETEFLWLQTNGMVRGINTTLTMSEQTNQGASGHATRSSAASLEQMVTLTSSTDALIFFLDPLSGLFTVIVGETIFKKISAHHALQMIKKHIVSAPIHKGIRHEKVNRTAVHQRSA